MSPSSHWAATRWSTLTGLDYPLDHGRLPADACLGLGNHVVSTGEGVIEVHAGVVAVLVEADESFLTERPPTDVRVSTARSWRGFALVWTAAIVVSGVLPIGSVVEAIGPPDPVTTTGHFVAYAALGFVLTIAIGGWRVTARGSASPSCSRCRSGR